jgi:Domain of unknown function (DUF4268)
MLELGRLETVDPRSIWPHEARDLAPWLLGHAEHLADALRIDLELEAAEHPVGGYLLDLVGRDLTNDAVLIVENQLGETDHSHLGQVLTYAAGTAASTIVWIATSFREEHRQALDWLNQGTGDEAHFFGLELAVVRIGDSAPAPLFRVVSEPNEWQKRVRAATRATQAGGKTALYVEFWSRFLERLRTEHPDWTRATKPQAQNWMSMPAPIKGGSYFAVSFAAGGRLRTELYIDSRDAEESMRIYEQLSVQRAVLESAYGGPLEFEPLEGRRACRIAVYRSGAVSERERWEEFIDWFFASGISLRRALATAELP